MKNFSIWNDNVDVSNYPKLNDDLNVDVLIIGGGMTGVSTFYHLKDAGLKIALVEQNLIGRSTSGNSTGKLSFLQNDLIDKIKEKVGKEKALLYLDSQKYAISHLVESIKKEHIQCDLERTDSYLFSGKVKDVPKVRDLEKFLNENGIATEQERPDFIQSKYAFKVENTYILNPVKAIMGILEKADSKCSNNSIYEKTSIVSIKKQDGHYVCMTYERKTITSEYIVLASHYPYFMFPYLFPFKVRLEKSYLSASPCKAKSLSAISYSNPFLSIRTYRDYLIYLSNTHSLEKNSCSRENFEALQSKLKKMQLQPEYLWSNVDIMTSDGLPFIGQFQDGFLIGTGYNTWGLATGFLAGEIISDIICRKANKYIELFNPKRQGLSNISNIFKNGKGFLTGMASGTKYHCPHMGCRLIYNEVENTYDCPCHGSRFSQNGECIEAPSNKNAEINEKN